MPPTALDGRYAAFVTDAREAARRQLDALQAKERYERYLLAEARDQSRATSLLHERHSTSETRAHAQALAEIERERRHLIETDSDAFFVWHQEELGSDLRDQEAGRLIDVPYLARARRAIASSLDAGIPVYLVGHLGSGKTQLAVEAAEDYSYGRTVDTELAQEMDAWEKEHPGATYEERCVHFNEAYEKATSAL